METSKITEIQRILSTRLDALEHLLSVAEKHFPEADAFLDKRLAEDMLPFTAQIAFACNQPRGFSQWCAGQPIENLKPDSIHSLAEARAAIAQTRQLVAGIAVDDTQLDQVKRIGLGAGMYCELPGDQYVADYVVPNLYFHMTTAYSILRMLGAPVGKADFMRFIAPYVKQESVGA